MLFGVPNKGIDVRNMMEAMAFGDGADPRKELLEILQLSSGALEKNMEHLKQIIPQGNLKAISFYEAKPSPDIELVSNPI